MNSKKYKSFEIDYNNSFADDISLSSNEELIKKNEPGYQNSSHYNSIPVRSRKSSPSTLQLCCTLFWFAMCAVFITLLIMYEPFKRWDDIDIGTEVDLNTLYNMPSNFTCTEVEFTGKYRVEMNNSDGTYIGYFFRRYNNAGSSTYQFVSHNDILNKSVFISTSTETKLSSYIGEYFRSSVIFKSIDGLGSDVSQYNIDSRLYQQMLMVSLGNISMSVDIYKNNKKIAFINQINFLHHEVKIMNLQNQTLATFMKPSVNVTKYEKFRYFDIPMSYNILVKNTSEIDVWFVASLNSYYIMKLRYLKEYFKDFI